MCVHTTFCLCLLRLQQRGAKQLAGGRRGPGEAYHTGACGLLTSMGGWKSYEPGKPMMGCRTWLAPFGRTSPSAESWAMTVLSPSLNLRSEGAGRRLDGFNVYSLDE